MCIRDRTSTVHWTSFLNNNSNKNSITQFVKLIKKLFVSSFINKFGHNCFYSLGIYSRWHSLLNPRWHFLRNPKWWNLLKPRFHSLLKPRFHSLLNPRCTVCCWAVIQMVTLWLFSSNKTIGQLELSWWTAVRLYSGFVTKIINRSVRKFVFDFRELYLSLIHI